MYDVIIIGGGASGLMAAITAARGGAKVTILEHYDFPEDLKELIHECQKGTYLSDRECHVCPNNCTTCINSHQCTSCDDDFVFDNEMLALVSYYGYKIGEISCPTKYFPEASSINFVRSCKYGLGVLSVSIKYFLAYTGIYKSKIFKKDAQKLDINKDLPYYTKKDN